MDLDAKICYCFHVTRRKLVNFMRQRKPKVPSQLSECGGAGTGCGWCIPFLKQLHAQSFPPSPPGRGAGGEGERPDSQTDLDLQTLTPEQYAARRAEYIRAGKGTPPPGATALPPDPKPAGE